ncbi:MAG: glycosyltransferase [Bacteroidetes bacterium]|nr:glycosyltransferase [Bacteroidota bacterium]
MMSEIAVFIFFLYALLLLGSLAVFFMYREKKEPSFLIPTEKISILIPFKNEEENIVRCLKSLVEQDFTQGQMELILINDHSSDASETTARSFLEQAAVPFCIISLPLAASGKKQAIEAGIAQATGAIIITRDADTYTPSKQWLQQMAHRFVQQKADLLIAPVLLTGYGFLPSFQCFEAIAIQVLSFSFTKKNLPFVCSGANLMYRKSCFIEANPYKNNIHIASGDDLFLLQRFIQKKYRITTTQQTDTLVCSLAAPSFVLFLHQRLRWLSKGKHITLKTAWFVGSFMLLIQLSALVLLFSGFNNRFCLLTLAGKFVIDFLFVLLGAIMYKQKPNFIYFIPAFVMNIFYTPFIFAASLVITPIWKGKNTGVEYRK